MVFLISPSIGPAIGATPSPDLINALQHLADSRRCGLNEILGDRDVLRAVSVCPHLSTPARAVYAKLSEISTRMYHLLSRCSLHVLVTEQPSICTRETASGQERIVLSVEHLARHQHLAQNPHLLCENLDDCSFLTWVGSLYADWNRLPAQMHLEDRNGGGHTTAHVYETILQGRDVLCLCISDSDLKYEGDTALGETAAALQEVNDRNDTTLAHLHILSCQEAENLVPASILADVYRSDTNKLDATSDVQSLQDELTHELWRYYDTKNGIRAFQFLSPPNPQFQTSWSRIFGAPTDVTRNNCPDCAKYNTCQKKSDCTTYLAKGLGTTVLPDTVESFFRKRSSAEISRRIPARIKPEWETIGLLVWTWGTAGFRMAAC
jgi:hypothetical protein